MLFLPLAWTGEAEESAPDEAALRRAVRLRSGALADLEQGQFERAAGRLEELAQILPDNVLPPVDLAIAYFALGRRDDALRQADRALALDATNAQALFAVAWSLRFEPAAEVRWHEVVARFAAAHPRDARPHYLEALHLRELHAPHESQPQEVLAALLRAYDRDADNLMLCLMLLESALAAGDVDAASDALDAVEDRLGGFPERAAPHAAELRQLLVAGAFTFDFGDFGNTGRGDAGSEESVALKDDIQKARPRTAVLHNLLRSHDLYRLGSQRLTGGASGATFAMQDFLPALPKSVQGGADIEIAFTALPELDANSSLLVPARRRGRAGLLLVGSNSLFEIDGIDSLKRFDPFGSLPVAVGSWDVTGDGATDLVLADAGSVRVVASWLEGSRDEREIFVFEAAGDPSGLWPFDVDHDGDLDLFLGSRYLRNDGSIWTDQTGRLGLVDPSSAGVVTDTASADFDDDGDLDLVLLRDGRPVYFDNRRAGALVESTEASGLEVVGIDARSLNMADFDGDGRFDLLFWGQVGAEIWTYDGTRFARAGAAGLEGTWNATAVGDFDNDGDVDVAAQIGSDLRLLRNREGVLVVETPFPAFFPALEDGRWRSLREMRAADLDDDGDLDLAALDESGRLHRWRNDGGNANHWLRLTLVGREHNNSKNNTQGLFARVEARVGDRFQAVPGDGGVNHLGLGSSRRAEVVRVVWPNGLAQFWQRVAANQSLVEEQVLKGSCPFLYSWDGDGFRFVTDLMWRSPLGMVMADGRAAPHQSARDAVLLPRGSLQPMGDELWLSVTEELWEAAYIDEQVLYAVDHLADLELVVDERILPPPYPEALPLHFVSRSAPPTIALLITAEGRRDVMPEIAFRDEDYVGGLPLTRYQGLTEGQTLELRFEGLEEVVAADTTLRLLLWGWTFPTDTSINVALAADPELDLQGPSLEAVIDGRWQELSPFVGFPAGKRKGMVVELPPVVVRDGSVTLRLRTNLQIYWDAVALAPGLPEASFTAAVTPLVPRAADLHPRGLSRLLRQSPDGPHLFDYGTVDTQQHFRPMTGRVTRFGDVTELLASADDLYVVMAAGDEMTVVYEAGAQSPLPALPPGWVRDWVLYTDGWVKDADINTTASESVGPLPYRAMDGYPDPEGHAYPDTPATREFLRRYQTRRVESPNKKKATANGGWGGSGLRETVSIRAREGEVPRIPPARSTSLCNRKNPASLSGAEFRANRARE